MRGTMMDYPLTLHHFLERAYRFFPKKEIVSWVDTEVHRYTYGDFYPRVHRLAHALRTLGVRRGDRIGTFAWNHYRHLEVYFAVPCSGAVLHTLNIRLFPDQLAYVINHGGDRFIFVDPSLVPLLERVADRLEGVEGYIFFGTRDEIPETRLSPVYAYEDLLAAAPDEPYPWPTLDENDAAGMCYTSGTTGDPKGVVYSHRAIVLHSLAEAMTDTFQLSEKDVVFPVVPMFHANAWGMPFTCTLIGAKQVYPGPHLKPREMAQLIQDEKVTFAAGVPTLWIGLYHLLKQERYDISSLRALVVGGSAAPRALIEGFEKEFGVPIIHAWGMTEMTPLGTVSQLKSYMLDWPEEKRYEVRAKQGVFAPLVEGRIVDDEGKVLPWDGKSMGELQVRGPWVAASYYNDPRGAAAFTEDGWFRTGDVVTIDPEGYMQIMDRTKDLVKSGGEWISSVALENALMAHPKVMEAAVIAVPHEKWGERPLACVVPVPEHRDDITKAELLEFIAPKFPKWWLPDDIVFLDELPKTSVGKFDKKVLRARFQDYVLPTRE